MSGVTLNPAHSLTQGKPRCMFCVALLVDVGPVRIHEREVSTEQNTEVKEKEIKTLFIGGGTSDTVSVLGGAAAPRRPTRSIGVGDDRVVETDAESSVQVHERELRTVYVDGGGSGGTVPAPKSTRNVGILCKAAMREVGVMYHCEDAAPMTRNIAVGVGEMGVSDGFELAERSDSSVHVTNMALQQLNMAAFQSRHLRFSNEQLRDVLDMMLKKNLRSVAVQCRFATVDRAVSTGVGSAEYSVTVGVGDDTVEVNVVPVRSFRSAAVDCRPSVFHRACGADFIYRVDSATNTRTQGVRVERGCNTDAVVRYPASTNTESRLSGETVATETEPVMFESTAGGGGPSSVGGPKTAEAVGSVEVRKATSPQTLAPSGTGASTEKSSKAGGTESSEQVRQKKRDSMLFGDMDEPPLIVAGGEHYHPVDSDTTLSTSLTSVGSSGAHLVMPGRTVSEPAFSQTMSTSSQESFVCRSDDALLHGGLRADDRTRQMLMAQGLETSDSSVGTLGQLLCFSFEKLPRRSADFSSAVYSRHDSLLVLG